MYGTVVKCHENYEKTTKEIDVRPRPRCVDRGRGGKHVLRNQTGGGRQAVTTVTAHSRSENLSANTLGTVDRAIRERNIFTALSKMPTQVRTALFENGWIEKKPADIIRNEPKVVLSLHKNVERVRNVAKRYESGFLWTDTYTGGVNWMELHQSVVVNRFPRDAYTAIKLCGWAMAGRTEFIDYFPRAYPATVKAVTGSFVKDYALTACVSLLRAFVDGVTSCKNCGQVPISTLYFAINKCNQYKNECMDGLILDNQTEWNVFFEHYYKIVDDYQHFTTLSDEKVASVMTMSRQLLEELSALRSQTIMDGYKSFWIIKCNQPSVHQPFMSNKIEDILKKCTQLNGDDNIIQKYIETPLLYKNVKFNVQTWIVISTLDYCLTVWMFRKCCLQFYTHKFSLNVKKSKYDHFKHFESNELAINSPMQTCNLKQLKEKLRAIGVGRHNDSTIYSKIKTTIVSSISTIVNHINLRPNCLELFQVTFVLGSDLHPWLIDIKSDPCLAYPFYHTMSSIMNGVAKNLAKILTDKDRVSKTNIGMFELIHKRSIPGKYIARAFVEKTVSKKCYKVEIKNIRKIYNDQRTHHWNNDLISTYIENIQVSEIDNKYYRTRKLKSNSNQVLTENIKFTKDIIVDNNLCLIHLKQSMSRLISGSKINAHEAKYCLDLLDKWKAKVTSAQKLYKDVIMENKSHKKNYKNSK